MVGSGELGIAREKAQIWPAIKFVLEKLEGFKTQYTDLDESTESLPPAYSTRRRRRTPSPRPPTTDLHLDSRKHLRTAINNAWDKLRKYYEKSDETPVYAATLILNPGQKWKYVKRK